MNPEEVARIAKLALIDLTEEEVEKFAGELDVIIDAVEVVSDAVSEDSPATSHPLPLSNVFREDVPARLCRPTSSSPPRRRPKTGGSPSPRSWEKTHE